MEVKRFNINGVIVNTPSIAAHILQSSVGRLCSEPPTLRVKSEVLEAEHFYAVYPEKFDVDGAPPCHGQCYNDYPTSKYIGFYSHYTCPDKCVHWSGMCRGVSWCEGDQEICGEDLRCPQTDIGNVTKHTMVTNPPRSYCFGDTSGITGQDRLYGGPGGK